MDYSWIPNAISLMRLFMIAPIIMLFVSNEYGWALALFTIAGLSDGIDGWIAKKYDWNTRLGAFLDPAADKLLVAWSFGTLAYLGQIPVWLAAVVIGRDVAIVTGSFLYHYLVEPLHGLAHVVRCIGRCRQGETAGELVGRQVHVLPVEALRLPSNAVETLHELDIRRIEQLQSLPRTSLPSRFGPHVLRRLDQAWGRLSEPPERRRPARPAPPRRPGPGAGRVR